MFFGKIKTAHHENRSKPLILLVGRQGFEPRTNGLRVSCTIEQKQALMCILFGTDGVVSDCFSIAQHSILGTIAAALYRPLATSAIPRRFGNGIAVDGLLCVLGSGRKRS
jgi:hypothetical protein